MYVVLAVSDIYFCFFFYQDELKDLITKEHKKIDKEIIVRQKELDKLRERKS